MPRRGTGEASTAVSSDPMAGFVFMLAIATPAEAGITERYRF